MNEVPKRLQLLNEVVKSCLSPEEVKTSKHLLFFIRRSLIQMGLHPEWHESGILIEAYLVVHKQVREGREIQNFPAYLARVSHFIILEKKKQRARNYKISQKISGIKEDVMSISTDSYSEGLSQEIVTTLWSLFDSLSDKERRILTLRVIKGFSWNEIAYAFVELEIEEEYSSSLVTRLRKQGNRALEKLRKGMLPVNNVN